MCPPLIEISELTKQFGLVQALDGLNLRIFPGEIYGLLGPNGAGKTTTIRAIIGLVQPTSGWITVGGFDPIIDPVKVKSIIGYVAEKQILYESLSTRDFLEFVASIRKIDPTSVNRLVTQLGEVFEMAKYFDAQ